MFKTCGITILDYIPQSLHNPQNISDLFYSFPESIKILPTINMLNLLKEEYTLNDFMYNAYKEKILNKTTNKI